MGTNHHSRKAPFVLLLCIVGTSVCLAQGIHENPFVNPSSAVQWVEDEIIVKFNPGCPSAEIERIHAEMGGTPVAVGQDKNVRLVKTPPGIALENMIQAYSRNPHVQYAEKNFVAHAHMVPNDPYYKVLQWNFFHIDMASAWDIETGDPAVIVAVLDTGVAYENYTEGIGRRAKKYVLAPDLAGTLFVAGYDFVNNDTHPNDDNAHGTHVTGTIAQTTNNGLGVAGIAYNCAVMPVKVLDGNGSGSYLSIANGIKWAADNGADVINMSLGGSSGSTTLEEAVNYAYNKGVTIVASSGNDAAGSVGYPAAYANVIAVGATHSGFELASYSNYGTAIDIVAPGGDEFDRNGDTYGDGVLQNTFNPTTKNTSDFGYWFFSGTSMAAPHVSGVAALLIANGISTPDLVRQAMQETAFNLGDPGWDQYYGWGLVNAYTALLWIPSGPLPPIADFSATPLSGDAPLEVIFTDRSTGATVWSWDFGDQSSDSSTSPKHTYENPGTYTVTLTVTGEGGTDTETKTDYITVTDPSSLITMRVTGFDLVPVDRKVGTNHFVKANATITVVKQNADGSESTLSGVTVEGDWSGSVSGVVSGVTSDNGTVLFSSSEVKTKKGTLTFTFTIDRVTLSGYSWDEPGSTTTTKTVSLTI